MSDSFWTVLSNFSLPERSMLRRSKRYSYPFSSPFSFLDSQVTCCFFSSVIWAVIDGMLQAVLRFYLCSHTVLCDFFIYFIFLLDFGGHAHFRPSTCTSYYVPSSQSVCVKIMTALQQGAQIMTWPDMQESNMMFESGQFCSDLPCWSKLARRCAQMCSWVRQRSSIIAFHPFLLVAWRDRWGEGTVLA